MEDKYSYTKKTQQYKDFQLYLTRVLSQRGRRRTENVEVLENHFCKVWCDAQTLHLDQYRELMKDKRNLRNQICELKEEQDKELSALENEIENLREQLVVRKQV